MGLSVNHCDVGKMLILSNILSHYEIRVSLEVYVVLDPLTFFVEHGDAM